MVVIDPLVALQSRIEQLETRLGAGARSASSDGEVSSRAPESVAEALLAAASCITTVTAGQEKLTAASHRADELSTYIDHDFLHNMQKSEMKMQELLASESEIQYHCQCMEAYQKLAPVLNSSELQAVPKLQSELSRIQTGETSLRMDAQSISNGVQKVAETCGLAASRATESLMQVAKKLEAVENKLNPKPTSGLD